MRCMGRRGPPPQSVERFRGHQVLLRGSTPAIRVDPSNPLHVVLGSADGYVSIHRLVAAEQHPDVAVGRAKIKWITRPQAWSVRPLDGDPWNWQPDNLVVVARDAHLRKAPAVRQGFPYSAVKTTKVKKTKR